MGRIVTALISILTLATFASYALSAEQQSTGEYLNSRTMYYSYLENGGATNTYSEIIYTTSKRIKITVTNVTPYPLPDSWNYSPWEPRFAECTVYERNGDVEHNFSTRHLLLLGECGSEVVYYTSYDTSSYINVVSFNIDIELKTPGSSLRVTYEYD